MNNGLNDFIKTIDRKSRESTAPILVSVSGGSCTGKSTFVNEIIKAFNDIQVLHQDDYQLGVNFTRRKESKYKWDDPENFQIEQCASDLKKFLQGDPTLIPTFDLKQNVNIGTRIVKARKINILEGIYSELPPLAALNSCSLYIETPYYVRFLRRIHRFITNNQTEDLSTPLRHMTTSVLLAHREFVVRQKQYATFVLRGDEIIPSFPEKVIQMPAVFNPQILFEYKQYSIIIHKGKENYLGIRQNGVFVYFEHITEEIILSLDNISWMEL